MKFAFLRSSHQKNLLCQSCIENRSPTEELVTRLEFYNEGANTRDLIARAYERITSLSIRVYQLEKQMQEWRKQLS